MDTGMIVKLVISAMIAIIFWGLVLLPIVDNITSAEGFDPMYKALIDVVLILILVLVVWFIAQEFMKNRA